MFFVAILLAVFCAAVGVMHPDLMKVLLFLMWVGLAVMAIGSTLYSVFLLLA